MCALEAQLKREENTDYTALELLVVVLTAKNKTNWDQIFLL